jgi:hypothetical protein
MSGKTSHTMDARVWPDIRVKEGTGYGGFWSFHLDWASCSIPLTYFHKVINPEQFEVNKKGSQPSYRVVLDTAR